MEFIYPAVLENAEEGGYTVTFPDFPGAVTEGDSLQEALDMAEDCLSGIMLVYEENKRPFPKSTSLTELPPNTADVFATLVKVNLVEYKKRVLDKPVKKTLYIPKGLNDEAEAQGINFSQVLRDALHKTLHKQ